MEGNLRVCVVIATFHPIVGGAEKQALAQCRNLRGRGCEASILTFRHSRQWPRRENVQGVPVVRIAGALLAGREKLPRLLRRCAYALALAALGWELWRRRRDYDVLHVHQFTMLAPAAALACWLAHKPMIVVVHSAGLGKREKSPHKLSLVAGPLDSALPLLQIDALSKAGGDLASLARLGHIGMRASHALLRRIRAVPVVVGSRMKDYLAAYNFTLPGVRVIPNGVDTSHFHPAYAAPAPIERDGAVLCVSRLSYEKGIDVLLQAWNLLRQMAPDLKAHLVIAGGGPLEARLKWMAQALGIAGSVEFAGERSDIAELLRRSSLAVLPSRWEGMPVALLEAMACGLPCVATRVSGSEDIIRHGINGLLVEPEDYQCLAVAMASLLGDPAALEGYGRAARATVEEHYSLERITSAYLELYRDVIDPLEDQAPQRRSWGREV